MATTMTLRERIGGPAMVERVCNALHVRVMQNSQVAHFFADMEVADIHVRQKKLMACLLDDSQLTDLRRLRRIHQPLIENMGLSHGHFDTMKTLLDQAMQEAGIDACLRRLVLNRMETTREFIFLTKKTKGANAMKGFMALIYGGISYAVGMGSLIYISLWLLGLVVPNTLDNADAVFTWQALATNLGLVGLFGLQHSGMARPRFKQFVSRAIPHHVERSTYVLISGIATVALCYFWQPLGVVIWAPQSEIVLGSIYSLFALGFGILVMSTFWINHFDLFGLRQVWLYFKQETYSHVPFKTPGLYAYVRHPLYIGWLMVIWAAPVMTVSHLVFAAATTLYILKAITWEEKDLCDALPEYRRYRRSTPMMVPGVGRNRQASPKDNLAVTS